MIFGFVFALVVAPFQQGSSPEPQAAIQLSNYPTACSRRVRTTQASCDSHQRTCRANSIGSRRQFGRVRNRWSLPERTKELPRLGPAAVSVSELPMLNMRRLQLGKTYLRAAHCRWHRSRSPSYVGAGKSNHLDDAERVRARA
jgi:hypothetical protein